MRTRTIIAKISAALIVVLVTAVTTTAVLAYFIYERTQSKIVNSRFSFIAMELKNQIEAGLDLGLPLGELENVKALLHQHLASDHALVSLSIINARGMVLFDTEEARVGKYAEVKWLKQGVHSSSETPVFVNKTNILVPLSTNYGKFVGNLVLRISNRYYETKQDQIIATLASVTIVIIIACAIISVIGVVIISQPFHRSFRNVERELQSAILSVSKTGETTDRNELLNNIVVIPYDALSNVGNTIRSGCGAGAGKS